jgi:hypothetical protein
MELKTWYFNDVTTWRKSPSREANSGSATQGIPCLCETRSFISVLTGPCHWIVCQTSPVQTFQPILPLNKNVCKEEFVV